MASVSAIIRFKGNSRNGTKLFHSKYQILSMISTTFKEMYSDGDFSHVSDSWNERKDLIAKNLKLYYVYDIITNYWSEGGTGKIHSAAKPNRYANEISPRAWRIALDAFFEKSMFRTESRQIANPKSEEYVLLNCIYLNTFTAMDQLSINKFDVEHIAPKEQMKKLIAATSGAGLPISCIANLCYLPEYVNRSKRDRNFYQDTKYLLHINLDEVERKYSFTTRDDLEWMDMPYDGPEDFDELKEFYFDFCNNRFAILKKLFCESMGIDYEAMNTQTEEQMEVPERTLAQPVSRSNNLVTECVDRVNSKLNLNLQKVSRSAFVSGDGLKGFVFCVSKAYKQGNREKYWFGYRRNPLEDIQNCPEKYMVYGCRDAKEVLIIPVDVVEGTISSLNYSTDDDGQISHWHIVFFRDSSGHMTQLLSKPDLQEIEINQYKI